MMRACYPSIKGVGSESVCHFLRHHMSLKNEMIAFEKADTEDEMSHPLSRLPTTPITAQPVPSRGLWAPNDDHELTVKGGHA